MTKYTRKTRDYWVLQGNYGHGHGWEDLTAEETYQQIRERKREYRANEPGTALRIVRKRERIQTQQEAEWPPNNA